MQSFFTTSIYYVIIIKNNKGFKMHNMVNQLTKKLDEFIYMIGELIL